MLGYCMRRTSQPGDAHDAVAEVYAIAWRKRQQLQTVDLPVAWLIGVARRVLANKYRSSRRRARLVERLQHVPTRRVVDPVDVVTGDETVTAALAILAELTPADRELVTLATWEDLSHQEIAEVVGKSAAAVRTRLYRIRQTLRSDPRWQNHRDIGLQPDTTTPKSSGPSGSARNGRHS